MLVSSNIQWLNTALYQDSETNNLSFLVKELTEKCTKVLIKKMGSFLL
jgi:hypothetical protein